VKKENLPIKFVQYVKGHLNGEKNGDLIGKKLSIVQKNVHQKNKKFL